MSTMTWDDRYDASLMNTFGHPQLVLVSGHGSHVVDEDGKAYLDLLGGIAVNVLGQTHPAVVRAISEQAGTLGHVSNFFATPPQIELAEHLLRIVEPGGAPVGSKVFLANSGTEANECALKIVRAHANAHKLAEGDPPDHGIGNKIVAHVAGRAGYRNNHLQNLACGNALQGRVAEKQHHRHRNNAPASTCHAAQKSCEQPNTKEQQGVAPLAQPLRKPHALPRWQHGIQA